MWVLSEADDLIARRFRVGDREHEIKAEVLILVGMLFVSLGSAIPLLRVRSDFGTHAHLNSNLGDC